MNTYTDVDKWQWQFHDDHGWLVIDKHEYEYKQTQPVCNLCGAISPFDHPESCDNHPQNKAKAEPKCRGKIRWN